MLKWLRAIGVGHKGNFGSAVARSSTVDSPFPPWTPSGEKGCTLRCATAACRADRVPVGAVRVTFTALEYTGREVTIMGVTAPESIMIVPRAYRAGMDIQVRAGDIIRDFDLPENRPPTARPA